MKRSQAPSQVAKRAKAARMAKQPVYRTSIVKLPRQVGFNKQIVFKHRFVERNLMAPSAGSITNQRYRCNGMFDPNQTGGGQQPMYFDQVAAIYNHYVVTSAKITVEWTPVPASNQPFIAGIYINDDATTSLTDLANFCEQSTAVYRSGGGPDFNGVKLTKYWNAKSVFGGDILSNSRLEGTGGSDPTEQQIFNVFIGAINSLNAISTEILVTIEYTAVWRELKDIDGS